jgi:hypothetical protein
MSERTAFRCLVLVAAACLASTATFASGGYVGASAGQSNTQIEASPGTSFDGNGTSFKVQGGYRLLKYFGVEADYRDFGTQDDTVLGQSVEVDTTALDLFAVGVIPVGGAFEVFGKAGFSSWDADIQTVGQPSVSDDGGDLAYGLGGAYVMGKFALRLEYEQFDIEDADDVNIASLGFDFRF